jgi:membrane protease YdiL (CAAX protease family)
MDQTQLKTLIIYPIVLGICALVLFSGLLGMTSVVVLVGVVFLAGYFDSGKKLIPSFGFQQKKATAFNLVVLAPVTAFLIVVLYRYVLLPIVTDFTGVPIDISGFDPIRGNLSALWTMLAFVWISAAFGEEIVFRGYLMTRFSIIFGTSTSATIANIFLLGIFFGSVHFYQGITGQILSGITGAIIATLFYLKKNDLWFCIIVHGMVNTIALTAVYFNIF